MTGGYGFLGSHLVTGLLARAATVTVLDVVERPAFPIPEADGRLRYVDGSVTDRDAVQDAVRDADAVVHLAAIASPRTCEERPEAAVAVNVEGTRNVLEVTRDGTRFVFMSSAAVYGKPESLPINEGHSLLGTDRYALTKQAGEELCRAHARRLHMSIVRNFNTYGPGQTADYLIPKVILQGIRDRRIEVWNTTPVRDYMYVEDTVAALSRLTFMDGDSPDLLNLGSGEGHSVGQILSFVDRALGGVELRDLGKPVTGSPILVADNLLARTALTWQPRVSLDLGLRRTVDWFRSRAS